MFVVVVVVVVVFTAAKLPSVYVTLELDMTQARVCFLERLFREELSQELIEVQDGDAYSVVSVKRIKIMSPQHNTCGRPDKNSGIETSLDFYITKSESDLVTVNRAMTIHAYDILYDYWKNRKMREIDVVFSGKVS